MHPGDPGRRCLPTLMAGLLLSLIVVPDALAGEWERIRESYDNTLSAHAKRIEEIEAKERGVSADREERAAKITRDRITAIRVSLKGGGKEKSLAEAAGYLEIVASEWGAQGAERKKLREAMATLQKNLERVNANLARAAEATTPPVEQSGVLEKAARIEAAASEARERLRARWQREQAAREREREQREREAAERGRGVR